MKVVFNADMFSHCRGTVEQSSKPKGSKAAAGKGAQGLDFGFKTEKTALHDKYSSPAKGSISGGTEKRHRKGSDEDRREHNGLSLPELRKSEGKHQQIYEQNT